MLRKEHLEASSALKRVIEIDPKNFDAWVGLGNALMGLMQFVEAAQAFRRATELKPDDPFSWKQLAMSLVMVSEFDDALGVVRKALEIDSNDAQTKMLLRDLQSADRESIFGELQHRAWMERLEKHRSDLAHGG